MPKQVRPERRSAPLPTRRAWQQWLATLHFFWPRHLDASFNAIKNQEATPVNVSYGVHRRARGLGPASAAERVDVDAASSDFVNSKFEFGDVIGLFVEELFKGEKMTHDTLLFGDQLHSHI